jgi:hypothetical protein
MVSFMLRLIDLLARSPQYPLDRGLVGPRASLIAVAKRNILNPTNTHNPGHPSCSHHYFSNNNFINYNIEFKYTL